jgi:hypothetical protein
MHFSSGTVVNIRFVLAIVKEGAGSVFLTETLTLNRHVLLHIRVLVTTLKLLHSEYVISDCLK